MHAADDRCRQPTSNVDGRRPDPHRAVAAGGHPSVELSVDGDHAVAWLSGDVDLANAEHVIEFGTLAIADSRVNELVVDLSQVTFLDSTGLGALVHLGNHSKTVGTRLALRGVTPPVSKLLSITGLDKAFEVVPASDAGR